MIKVCPHCSGIDIDGLKKAFANVEVKLGCLGKCKKIKDKVYGKVNNEYVVADSNQAFIEEVKKLLE